MNHGENAGFDFPGKVRISVTIIARRVARLGGHDYEIETAARCYNGNAAYSLGLGGVTDYSFSAIT